MSMPIEPGTQDVITYFMMRLAADGTAATGLTPADFDLQYVRSGALPSAKVDATALAAADSTHADNKVIEIDATDQPGLYRVDWPDAAFVAGVREVILGVKVALAFAEELRVDLTGVLGSTLGPFDLDVTGGDVERDTVVLDFGRHNTGLTIGLITVTKWNKDQSAWGATDAGTAVASEIGNGLYELLVDENDRNVVGAASFRGVYTDNETAITIANVHAAVTANTGKPASSPLVPQGS